jgi:GT2 family glycosyltransferase
MVRGAFPEVQIIANTENLGFAAGNNQAIRAGGSPFVLILNPDTEVQPGALDTLLHTFAEAPRAGAAAPRLVFPDGSVQLSCRSFPAPSALLWDASGLTRVFPHSPTFGRYRMSHFDHSSFREVDQPMFSAVALRRRALDEIGLFDESFPLYFNDVDLSYRLWQAGWSILFQPAAEVIHYYGQSSTWQVRPAAILESHRSLIRFYRKHYRGRIGPITYGAVVAAAALTMYPRALLAWAAQRLRRGSRRRHS